MTDTFDLSEFDALVEAQDEGVDVEITHPKTGKPVGIVVRVAGPDSKKANTAKRAGIDRALAMQRKGQKPSAEHIEGAGILYLADVTLGWRTKDGDGWRDVVVRHGEDVAFSRAAAVELYTTVPIIRDQVNAVAGSRDDFFKA